MCVQIQSQNLDPDDHFFIIDINTWDRVHKEHDEEMLRQQRITKLRVTAMDIAIEQHKHKKIESFEEMVPEQYRSFSDIFT